MRLIAIIILVILLFGGPYYTWNNFGPGPGGALGFVLLVLLLLLIFGG